MESHGDLKEKSWVWRRCLPLKQDLGWQSQSLVPDPACNVGSQVPSYHNLWLGQAEKQSEAPRKPDSPHRWPELPGFRMMDRGLYEGRMYLMDTKPADPRLQKRSTDLYVEIFRPSCWKWMRPSGLEFGFSYLQAGFRMSYRHTLEPPASSHAKRWKNSHDLGAPHSHPKH